ncbi:MAG: GNAT family N-acetyltransferase [Hyphomicrobiales bacterium]|nr:GNAT family N-acetyltransferase [Hyphomicrobiales bacterium]PCJ96002.1 MAG: GNAT family N-acetyltransferase [Hyphomicrobiales bacterium]
MPLVIRNYQDTDAQETAQLFFNSVRNGTGDFYTKEQRAAWAPQIPELARWHTRLEEQITLIAELDQKLVGFMTLKQSGYIDLAFVNPDHIGNGIGRALYEAVEAKAEELSIERLTTQASLAAKAFFENFGWQVDKEQHLTRQSVTLTNFVMSKNLHPQN